MSDQSRESKAWQLLMHCAQFGNVELAFNRSATLWCTDGGVATVVGEWRAEFEGHDGEYRFEVQHADSTTAVARLAELVLERYVKKAKAA